MASLRPFVYRRYIDFGVIESLRGMKQMINAEVRRRGLQDNVKLGHGGIREVEFIAPVLPVDSRRPRTSACSSGNCWRCWSCAAAGLPARSGGG